MLTGGCGPTLQLVPYLYLPCFRFYDHHIVFHREYVLGLIPFATAAVKAHSSDISANFPLTPPTTPGLNFLASCVMNVVPSGIKPIMQFGPSMQSASETFLTVWQAWLSFLVSISDALKRRNYIFIISQRVFEMPA